jgi:hypothetical protein
MTPSRLPAAATTLVLILALAGCGDAARGEPVRPDARVVSEIATAQTLKLVVDDRELLYLDCTLDGKHGLFLIDTGCDFIGLSEHALADFGLAKSGKLVSGRSAFGDAALDTVASARIEICRGITLVSSNLPVFPMTGQEHAAGVIGGGVLTLLGATIDYQTKTLVLHP